MIDRIIYYTFFSFIARFMLLIGIFLYFIGFLIFNLATSSPEITRINTSFSCLTVPSLYKSGENGNNIYRCEKNVSEVKFMKEK